MDDSILKVMEAEAATLERRLVAVRALIAAYSPAPKEQSAIVPVLVERAKTAMQAAKPTMVDEVRRIAIDLVQNALDPVPTREIMKALEREGIHVAGTNPQNVVSSILSRTPELRSNGRIGWTYEKFDPFADLDAALRAADSSGESQSIRGFDL